MTALEPFFLPIVSVILGVGGKGIFDYVSARSGGRIAKMPTVEQIWARLETVEAKATATAATLDRVKDDLSTVRRVFRSYVERVQRGGTSDLTDDERSALDETENHQEAPR